MTDNNNRTNSASVKSSTHAVNNNYLSPNIYTHLLYLTDL